MGRQPGYLIRDGVGVEVGFWGRTRRMQSHFWYGLRHEGASEAESEHEEEDWNPRRRKVPP